MAGMATEAICVPHGYPLAPTQKLLIDPLNVGGKQPSGMLRTLDERAAKTKTGIGRMAAFFGVRDDAPTSAHQRLARMTFEERRQREPWGRNRSSPGGPYKLFRGAVPRLLQAEVASAVEAGCRYGVGPVRRVPRNRILASFAARASGRKH